MAAKDTYLCFLVKEEENEYVSLYPEVTAVVAVTSIEEWRVLKKEGGLVPDRHLAGELPPEIRKILGGEIMEAHFEVFLPFKEFILKASEAGMRFGGVV